MLQGGSHAALARTGGLGRCHLLGLGADFVDVADVEEGLLGEVVRFAVADFIEAAEGVGDLAYRRLSCR